MDTSSPFLGFLIVAAVVGLIVVVIGGMFWSQRRRKQARAELAAQMAFQELPDTSELLERVRLLYGRGVGRQLRIDYAYWRRLGEAMFHWFNLVDDGSGSSNSETTWVGEYLLLAQSPALNVPRLSIFAIPKLNGLAGELAGRAIQMGFNFAVSRSGMIRVDMPDDSDFNARFLVSGQHEGAVRAFLDEERRGRLVGMPFPSLHIEAGQDMVWVQPLMTAAAEKVEPQERLRQMIEITQRVIVIFS